VVADTTLLVGQVNAAALTGALVGDDSAVGCDDGTTPTGVVVTAGAGTELPP
jgi:hypothetical protein